MTAEQAQAIIDNLIIVQQLVSVLCGIILASIFSNVWGSGA